MQHAFAMHGDVATFDFDRRRLLTGSQVGHQRVACFAIAMQWSMRTNRLVLCTRQKLHASVGEGGVVDGQPARRGATVGCVDPIRLILVPREDGIVTKRLFCQQLIEVDHHAVTAQLTGNRCCTALEKISLQRGQILARQHHVDDGVRRWISTELPRGHVVEVTAFNVNLPLQERLVRIVDDLHLRLRHHTTQMHVAISAKTFEFLRCHDVFIAATTLVAGCVACRHRGHALWFSPGVTPSGGKRSPRGNGKYLWCHAPVTS